MRFLAMFTLQRIFWKIFLIFGLTNLVIVAIGTYVVLHTHQSESFKKKQEEFVRDISEIVLYRLDRGEKVNQKTLLNSVVVENSRYRRWVERHAIYIYEAETSKLVFKSNRHNKDKNTDLGLKLSVLSPAGKKYIVNTTVEFPRVDVITSLSRVNKLQFLLLLLTSAILSFLLSWSISSPLKKLGAFGRNYTGKTNDLDIDPKLLRRGDEIGDLSRDFKAMRQEIEKTIGSQQQLLHDVSHELRAPLARLQTAAGLMEQNLPGENMYLQRIHLECDNINGLIQQILNFSRAEQAPVNLKNVNLIEFIFAEIDAVKYQNKNRDIRFNTEVKSVFMDIDDDLLSHAIGNILQNACKHTDESLPIDVSLMERPDEVQIDIRDYGHGVKNSELSILVEPFYRANNKMHTEGFGLGLSIAKRSMVKNKGDLHIKNHPDGGLLVSLILGKV